MRKHGTLAVVGPNADDTSVLVGNYNGDPSHPVTVLAGIKRKLTGHANVLYAKGCEMRSDSPGQMDEALAVARRADAVVLVLGLNGRIEGEEGEGGDRASLDLPPAQEKLLEATAALGKPLVLVVMAGSSMSLHWGNAHVGAILQAWYPGQRGGDAVADVLFGDYNPAGRLPVTFYKSEKDLPPFTDYAMRGRTYRYFSGVPLFPFGFGLSYTSFAYSALQVAAAADGSHTVQVRVQNTGAAGRRRSGAVVPQPQECAARRGTAAPFAACLPAREPCARRKQDVAVPTRAIPIRAGQQGRGANGGSGRVPRRCRRKSAGLTNGDGQVHGPYRRSALRVPAVGSAEE